MQVSTPTGQDERLPRLFELPPFSAFEEISREFKVDFTLYGGAAARAAMYLRFRPTYTFDLFDIAPFTSDIDLRHSGDDTLTLEIREAIFELVPFASWCRWSLLSAGKTAIAQQNMDLSTRVPLRSIRFETKAESLLPDDALLDLRNGTVSVVRNPGFSDSGLARAGRDLEIFGALLALNMLVDLREVAGGGTLERWDMMRAWLDEPETLQQLARAGGASPLRARLWHLLAPQMANADTADDSWQAALAALRRAAAVQQFGIESGSVPEGHALSVSRVTVDGQFRVPKLFPSVLTGKPARTAVSKLLKKLMPKAAAARRAPHPAPLLDPAFEVVAFVPDLTVRRGTHSSEDEDAGHFSEAGEEFLHLTWNHDEGPKRSLSASALTAFALPSSFEHEPGTAKAPLAVGGLFRNGRPWVRIDVANFIGERHTSDQQIAVAVVQARDG